MSTRNIRWRRWSNEKSTDFTDFIQNTSIKFVRKKKLSTNKTNAYWAWSSFSFE